MVRQVPQQFSRGLLGGGLGTTALDPMNWHKLPLLLIFNSELKQGIISGHETHAIKWSKVLTETTTSNPGTEQPPPTLAQALSQP